MNSLATAAGGQKEARQASRERERTYLRLDIAVDEIGL